MHACAHMCIKGGRKGAETIPSMGKSIIQFIESLQVQVVCLL